MSRNTYDPKEIYTGDGSNLSYTFNFKIEANTQLEIVELDDTGVETQRVRGDDTVYLSSVTFNPTQGGGTVNLQSNLPNNYKLIILLANDAPTQPFEFSNKLSFNLKRIEAALDFIVGAVQRLTYRSKQSLRLHDSDNEEVINAQLPTSIVGQAGKTILVNDTEDGFVYGDVDEPVVTSDFTVTVPSQGRLSFGDVVTAGTTLEAVIIDMLQEDTPPVFSLAGSGAKLVESGTLISPILTPSFTPNDAGPANNYELRKNGTPIFTNPVPAAHGDTPFNIVDTSVNYEATVDHDANVLPAGSLISNTITYTGARAAFFQVGGDPVNIRTNSETLVGVSGGSQLVTTGDAVNVDCIFSYPDSLGDPTSLFLSNTGGNFDITTDLVREADQPVNDASGANPITYRVYSYTALIPIDTADTLTFTI